ncbi:hypothetical protein PspLS_09143 [Pyricularia sp. CBS 133598]|nr:hypothetical protein PspLS_09143 [Pyricularia sp. CBS 133598]
MYDNHIPNQDEYMDQDYQSQDMTRGPSEESFRSVITMQSGRDCLAPGAILSNQDHLQVDLGQQSQHMHVAAGFDQVQFTYDNNQTAQYLDFQGPGEIDWAGNAMDHGDVAYSDALAYGGAPYTQQGAATWDPVDTVVEGYRTQPQQYHEVPDFVQEPNFSMDGTWEAEPVSQPPDHIVQPTIPVEGPSSPKQLYWCPYPDCDAVFDRSANLTRHVAKSKKHALEEGSSSSPEIYHCGFRSCQRTGRDAIPRKDHCREHLRNYHKQDLYKRGEKVGIEWLKECLIDKAYWYCNKCLTRNSTVDMSSAWRCIRCGTKCENERIAIRLQR